MRGDMILAGYMLTQREWASLDTESQNELMAAAGEPRAASDAPARGSSAAGKKRAGVARK